MIKIKIGFNLKTEIMNQLELIKGILKLSEELKENEGITSVMIIDDMIRLVDKYTASQRQNVSINKEPIYTNEKR